MIQIFVTGGTIDKQYDTYSGELNFPQSYIDELICEANCTLPISIEILMQKDSLQINDQDRARIDQACLKTAANCIVITHGTDTMVETALSLKRHAPLCEKTIILTGAMRPFKLGHSDASFNLGSALMAAQLAQPGIWIAMNGQLFSANQVTKNLTLGQFEAI